MSLGRAYTVNQDAVENGVWSSEFSPDANIEVCIRSSRSRVAEETFARIADRNAPFLRQKRAVPQEVQTENLIEMAVAVVSSWRKLSNPAEPPEEVEGSPLPFSADNVRAMVTKYPDFRDQILAICNMYTRFRAKDVEERAKNSAASATRSSAPAEANRSEPASSPA